VPLVTATAEATGAVRMEADGEREGNSWKNSGRRTAGSDVPLLRWTLRTCSSVGGAGEGAPGEPRRRSSNLVKARFEYKYMGSGGGGG
jgi:hypothetical protein